MKQQTTPVFMHTLRYLLTLALFATLGLSASAQLQFGAGAATVGNFNTFGVQARAQYDIDATWRGAADFTYLFPEFGNAWELNPNVHYIFKDDGAGQKFYGLAGLGIFHYGIGDLFGIDIGRSVTDVGLNVGAGANLPLGNLTGYAEAKFGIGGSEFGLAVGVLFGN